MSLSSKHVKGLASLLLALAVFLFWRFAYPAALSYQEQFQLFLCTDDYFLSRLAQPGGIARYAAEFLVQFYNNFYAGALILAVLMVCVQRLMARLMRGRLYVLSFLPALLLWLLMGDENVMLTFTVALVFTLVAMLAWRGPSWWKWVLVVVGTPLLYWIVGPLVLLWTVFAACCMMEGKPRRWTAWVACAYALVLISASAQFLPYSYAHLLRGIDYYRYPTSVPLLMPVVVVVCALLAILGRRMTQKEVHRRAFVLSLAAGAVLVALFVVALPKAYESKKYELMTYDFLVRSNQWNAIVAKAQHKMPDLPMSVCATNLALAMTGQLGDHAFDFYQNGVGGLFPPFERNYNTLNVTSEAYFQLGLVNIAQRYTFEAMESLPNADKSVRTVKRLVETNLVNGQYNVAMKYVRMLEKTVFYRKWAGRMRQLIGDEKAIDNHPLYGRLRKWAPKSDFLFAEQEIGEVCAQLFLQHKDNNVAMQYMLLCPMLERDVDKVLQYTAMVQQQVQYNPRHVQEAVAMMLVRKKEQIPEGLVAPAVMNGLRQFLQTLTAEGKQSPNLGVYAHTAWYYLAVGERNL